MSKKITKDDLDHDLYYMIRRATDEQIDREAFNALKEKVDKLITFRDWAIKLVLGFVFLAMLGAFIGDSSI